MSTNWTSSIILLIIATLSKQCYSQQQKFAIEPEDISAVIGETIILPCRVVGKLGTIQWTKDDFGLGAHRNLSAFDRYFMIGHDDEGDYSLEIQAINLDDDAKFQCQVSPGPQGQPGIRSRFATLNVLVPSQPPTITQGDFYLATEGQEIQLECVSVGGKPVAELTWIDGLGNVITNGIDHVAEPLPDGKRFTVRSRLTLTPQKKHHNTTLICQSQNSADRNFKTTEIKMEVKYAPKIKLTINDDITEYSEVKVNCMATANPDDITYKWFINNELVVGDYTTEMVLHNVNRSLHKATIICQATNDIGTEEKSLRLNVIYPPVFKHAPQSVDADEKEVVKMSCDADGNPLEIVWVHDPIDRLNFHPRVVGTANKLKIIVSNETAGRYYCKASVTGYPEIKSEAIIFMKQAPVIESPRIQYGIKGDTLRLECAAFSVPKARHISWSFMGREINPTSADSDYAILDDPSLRRIKSTLVINNSQDWHFGKYNCTVVNDYGVDVLQIDLLHQNNFQFLMIIVGATSGVIILVIVIVLFLCIKLRGRRDMRTDKEKEFSADEQKSGGGGKTGDHCWKDGGDGGSSHSSDYKPDIKAASGSSESDYSIASTNFADSTIDSKEIIRGQSVPLAGPVDFPIKYRHSAAEYADTMGGYYPPKYSQTNYGYETHTDYARYCLAPSQKYGGSRNQMSNVVPPNADGYNFQTHHVNPGNIGVPVMIRQDNGLPGTRSSLIV